MRIYSISNLPEPIWPIIPTGMKDYTREIRDLMLRSGLKQAGFAEAIGTSQGNVSKWLNGSIPDDASKDKIDAYRRRLLGASDEPISSVQVDGRVGAGARIEPDAEQVPPDGLFEIQVPFAVPPESRAFEVSGDSMWPRYQAGDVIICWQQFVDPRELIGKEAVIQTLDGRRFLKRIRAGRKRSTYDLLSHNAPDLEDVKVEWAAKIGAIIPLGEWSALKRSPKPRVRG